MKKIFAALVLFSMIFSLTGYNNIHEERFNMLEITKNAIQESTGKNVKSIDVLSFYEGEVVNGLKDIGGRIKFENENEKIFQAQFDDKTKKLLKLAIWNSYSEVFDKFKNEKPLDEVKKIETPIVEDEDTKVANKVREYVKKYLDTKIDDITVNPDFGTEKNDDYVVLVRLTWNVKNSSEQSKKMLEMYSEDMAARMYQDLPEVQELAVFWTVPYLNNGNAKISFERVSGGMRYSDKVFDGNFNR